MPIRRDRWLAVALGALVVAGAGRPAAAQITAPIGRFVVDAQGTVARYDQHNQVATQLEVAGTTLPTIGFGLQVGAHVYPFRWRTITFGIGASGMWSRGRRTAVDAEGQPAGPTVETQLASLAPQVSLNFGKRDGWSYISAGIGTSIYTMRRADLPAPSSVPRVQTINFGAGARWFAKKHLAFSFDLRWYSLDAQEQTAETPAVPRTTRMVASAGVSIK